MNDIRLRKTISQILLAVGLALILAGGFARAASAQEDDPERTGLENALLPDLQTLPPYQLHLVFNQTRATRQLRFSNSIANTGAGRMELRGVHDNVADVVHVSQHFYNGDEEVFQKEGVGTMTFHAAHNHWHWVGFAVYEIWSLGPDAKPAELVASSDKVSYCLLDSERPTADWLNEHSPEPPPFTPRGYLECQWQRQGITPGWMDTYLSSLEGQEIDVSDLPDGVYGLVSKVNPDGVLTESDLSNNAAITIFTLDGYRLQVINNARDVWERLLTTEFGSAAEFGLAGKPGHAGFPAEPKRVNVRPPVPW